MKRLVFILAIVLAGCNTYQKQLNKFQLFAYNNPGEVAKICAKDYPFIGGETKSDTVIRIDTVKGQIHRDTIVVNGIKTIRLTDTIYLSHRVTIHDTTKILDNAKQIVLQMQKQVVHDSLTVSNTKLSSAIESSDKWRKWCLILGGVIGLSALGFIIKLFIKK